MGDVPVKEHNKVKVVVAKAKSKVNLMRYWVFEEVSDEGQEMIGFRQGIIMTEKEDGHMKMYKGRIEASKRKKLYSQIANNATRISEFDISKTEDDLLRFY